MMFLAEHLEQFYYYNRYLPTYLPADDTFLARVVWYDKQVKHFNLDKLSKVHRIISRNFNVPYVSIKFMAPRLSDFGVNFNQTYVLSEMNLYPFQVISEYNYCVKETLQESETGWTQSIASHSFLCPRGRPLIVHDVTKDWRFEKNSHRQSFGFYMSVPFLGPKGVPIGTLSFGDTKPRYAIAEEDIQNVLDMASLVSSIVQLSVNASELWRRDQMKRATEQFLPHILQETDFRGVDELAEAKLPDRRRSSDDGSASYSGEDYLRIYSYAAEQLRCSMGISGVVIFDLSNFVLVSKNSGLKKPVESVLHARLIKHQSMEESEDSSEDGLCAIPNPLPILGSSEPQFSPPDRKLPIDVPSVLALCRFLTRSRLGHLVEDKLPSTLLSLLPADARSPMFVPIMGVQRQPFALICCYGGRGAYSFVLDQMRHIAFQHVRSIGYMMMDIISRHSVVLADRAKSSFISNMSHELRTPLYGILASAELLDDTQLDNLQRTYTKTIESCGQGLLDLVNNVLDYTKLSTGPLSKAGKESISRLEPYDLVQLIQDVCDSSLVGHLSNPSRRSQSDKASLGSVYAPHQKGKKSTNDHVDLVIDIEKRMSGWLAICDYTGLRRVLMNLIGNSLKFTSKGYIIVSLRGSRATDDRMRVIFQVKDTGIGISRSFLDQHLFKPFSQENPVGGGTGLGLSIVHEIVSTFPRGALHVDSHPGEGTDIVVSLDVEISKSEDKLYCSQLSVQHEYTVHLVGFDSTLLAHRTLANVLTGYLSEWWGFRFQIHDDLATTSAAEQPLYSLASKSGPHDLYFINGDTTFLDTLRNAAKQHRFRPPPVLVLSELSEKHSSVSRWREYERAGGFILFLLRPAGPARLEKALQECLHHLAQVTAPGHELTAKSNDRIDLGAECERRPSNGVVSQTYVSSRPKPIPLNFKAHVQNAVETASSSHSFDERDIRRLPGLEHRLDQSLSPSTSSHTGWTTAPVTPIRPEHEIVDQPVLEPPSSQPFRVLFVDDNAINRQVMRAYLKKLRVSVTEATDGAEAIATFASRGPHYFNLILMDYSMPNVDGLGATITIRKLETDWEQQQHQRLGRSRCSIHMLSGTAAEDVVRLGYAAGADGYLVKPISYKVLSSVVKTAGYPS